MGADSGWAILAACLSDEFFQFTCRGAMSHMDARCHVFHARLRTHPDDVVHRHVVAEQIVFTTVDVDDTCHARLVNAEKVEETTVLAKLVCVVRVVARSFVVTRENNQAVSHLASKGLATFLVISVKHIYDSLSVCLKLVLQK